MPSGFTLLALALGAARRSRELEARAGVPSLLMPLGAAELCSAGAPCTDATLHVLDAPNAVGTESSFGSAREHANAKDMSGPTINSLGNALVFISKPNKG